MTNVLPWVSHNYLFAVVPSEQTRDKIYEFLKNNKNIDEVFKRSKYLVILPPEMRRFNDGKTLILHKLICRYHATPIKIPAGYVCDKILQNHNDTQRLFEWVHAQAGKSSLSVSRLCREAMAMGRLDAGLELHFLPLPKLTICVN